MGYFLTERGNSYPSFFACLASFIFEATTFVRILLILSAVICFGKML